MRDRTVENEIYGQFINLGCLIFGIIYMGYFRYKTIVDAKKKT